MEIFLIFKKRKSKLKCDCNVWLNIGGSNVMIYMFFKLIIKFCIGIK